MLNVSGELGYEGEVVELDGGKFVAALFERKCEGFVIGKDGAVLYL